MKTIMRLAICLILILATAFTIAYANSDENSTNSPSAIAESTSSHPEAYRQGAKIKTTKVESPSAQSESGTTFEPPDDELNKIAYIGDAVPAAPMGGSAPGGEPSKKEVIVEKLQEAPVEKAIEKIKEIVTTTPEEKVPDAVKEAVKTKKGG